VTRPHIVCGVGFLSRFMEDACVSHLHRTRRTLPLCDTFLDIQIVIGWEIKK